LTDHCSKQSVQEKLDAAARLLRNVQDHSWNIFVTLRLVGAITTCVPVPHTHTENKT